MLRLPWAPEKDLIPLIPTDSRAGAGRNAHLRPSMPPHSAGSRCAAALAGWWHSVTWRTAYVLFTVRRADIEGFARDLEAKGRARATVTRRRAPSPGLQVRREELLDHSRPRMSGGGGWTTSLMLLYWTATSSAPTSQALPGNRACRLGKAPRPPIPITMSQSRTATSGRTGTALTEI
jgi:hypothetical protein